MANLHKYCGSCAWFKPISDILGHCLFPNAVYTVRVDDCCHCDDDDDDV